MREFKPVIKFIATFFIVYILLVVIYNQYLSFYHSKNLPDPYSENVAYFSTVLANLFGFSATIENDISQPWTWIFFDGKRTSYINEGCNAVSIMIIFLAFMLAFAKGWKKTTLYIIAGLIVIQIMNILRIFLLNYVFRYYSDYGKPAHDYLFPLIIYGTVFCLWVVWVRYFVMKKSKSSEQVAQV